MYVFLQYAMGSVWVNEGTFMAYIFLDAGDYKLSELAYRESDGVATCTTFGQYPEMSSNCTRLYSINIDGSPSIQSAQYEFDARAEPWYALATERGSGSWSGPHYSPFSDDRIITYSIPNYDPVNAEYHSVSFASIRLNFCEFILISLITYIILFDIFSGSSLD